MPRLGGDETIRHIRTFDPRIRIVVIAGDASDETAGTSSAWGSSSW